jgi:cytochrome c1
MRNLTDVPVGLVVGAVCANLRVAVFQQGVTVQPGQLDGFYMRCPGTEPAIGGGFFGTDPHTFSEITLGDFYRRSSHAWTVAARDFGNDPVHWMAGVVCLR